MKVIIKDISLNSIVVYENINEVLGKSFDGFFGIRKNHSPVLYKLVCSELKLSGSNTQGIMVSLKKGLLYCENNVCKCFIYSI